MQYKEMMCGFVNTEVDPFRLVNCCYSRSPIVLAHSVGALTSTQFIS